jgi:branched-chain amino acid transport system permease protein
MTETRLLEILIFGLMTGGIYALISMGFSLQYGVARVINIAHGEFIMIAGHITFTLYTALKISPMIAIFICGPSLFIVGFLLHRTLFTSLRIRAPSPSAYEGNTMLAAFGVLYIIQNTALLIWRGVQKTIIWRPFQVEIGGAVFPENRLIALGVAIAAGVIFYIFVSRSKTGKAIRAAAQDPTTAGLMGININWLLPLCFGLGALMAGVAGVLVGITSTLSTQIGIGYTVIALIVVALGGLGSIPGSFVGGFILGIIGTAVSFYQPGLTMVAYYGIFLVLLLVRPTGIFGKR